MEAATLLDDDPPLQLAVAGRATLSSAGRLEMLWWTLQLQQPQHQPLDYKEIDFGGAVDDAALFQETPFPKIGSMFNFCR